VFRRFGSLFQRLKGQKSSRAGFWRAKTLQPLGSPQDSNDDLVELRAGTEEMAALDGAAGDLDEGLAFGDESESSTAIGVGWSGELAPFGPGFPSLFSRKGTP
jgi:hypothetical protein